MKEQEHLHHMSVQNLIGKAFRGIASSIESSLEDLKADETDDKGGEKHFHLAKLYLHRYLEEGKGNDDSSFALLAWNYFQEAGERGFHNIKDKHLQPIKDLAKFNYDKALQIYQEKSQSKFLELSAAYLKKSITFGGMPDGLVEGDLAKIYVDLGKNDLAYENFLKAVKLGKKLTELEEKFIYEHEKNTPHLLAAKSAKELYNKAKILYFGDKKDAIGAFEAMKESIKLDPSSGGEKEYQLARLYLDAYNTQEDTKYASLAQEWFQKAQANGRFVDDDKYLRPIRDLAAPHLRLAIDAYKMKELGKAETLLKASLSFGLVPGGEVEYWLARIYIDYGKKDLACELLQKALDLGKTINQAEQEFLDVYESKIEPQSLPDTTANSTTDSKKLAAEFYEKAKKLIEGKQYILAIEEMIESIRLDEGDGGEKHYILAKMYLATYLLEGTEDDVTYAVESQKWFQNATAKGKKNMDEKNLLKLKNLARIEYEKGVQIYQAKEQADYQDISASYFLKSLSLGGVPQGEAEYHLHVLFNERAQEYLAKAVKNGKLIGSNKKSIGLSEDALHDTQLKATNITVSPDPGEIPRCLSEVDL